MAGWWAGAQRRPITVNKSPGTAEPNRLLVIHVMQGTLWGTDSWFRNPAAQASAHFGVGLDGTCLQWVSCNQMAWHNANGNSYSIGVETEAYAGTRLRAAQIQKIGRLYRWVHNQYPDVKLWLNTNPTRGSGLSWHGLGGAAWGGHYGCPGKPRVDQLPAILKVAKGK